jgi:FkbM family methyltransferase
MKKGHVSHAKRRRLEKARQMWRFLKTQDAFRHAPLLTLLRSAAWYWRCISGKTTVVELPRWNVRMLFPAQRRGFGKFIFAFRECYEPELPYLEKILSPGKIFVDVGANFGVYTLVASRLVGETGRVLAFEPTAQSFAILRQNIELNCFRNVDGFQVALAETRGKAWLNYGWDPVGNWLGKDLRGENEGEEVRTESLDQLLEENGIDRVDAIKIDVEGAEELVLLGATRCLTHQRPIVIFEFNPACAYRIGLSPQGATDLLESLGYEFVLVGDCAKSSNPESRPDYFNIVAIPRHSTDGSPGSSHFVGDRRFRELRKREALVGGVGSL